MPSDFSNPTDYSILTMIEENMPVYDRAGDEVGKVEWVHFGDVSTTESEMGTGSATASDLRGTGEGQPGDDTWLEGLARGLGAEEKFNETVRARLLRHGFVQIEGPGLLSSDRYVMPEQIASVRDGKVFLSVSKDDMIKD